MAPGRRDFLRALLAAAGLAATATVPSDVVSAAPAAGTGPDGDPAATHRFRFIYGDPELRAQFLLFLTNVFHILPEDDLHRVIADACERHESDQAIYERIQRDIPRITPLLASLTYALPALGTQQEEMASETAQLVRDRGRIERYVEIGTPGRYVNALRRTLPIGEEVYLVHDHEPGMGFADIAERGQLARVGEYTSLANYDPLDPAVIPVGRVDLITNYIGLHHSPREKLDAWVESIRAALRPGGTFVLRDHDVTSERADTFVALAHDVFNAGLGNPWAFNDAELRFFLSIAETERYLGERGFRRFGPRIAQDGDPTRNLLLAFERT